MARYGCATGKHNGHESSRAASSCFVQADDARVATLERTVKQSIMCHGDWTLDDHVDYLLQDERSPETTEGEARNVVLRVHAAGHTLSDCVACEAGEPMTHAFEQRQSCAECDDPQTYSAISGKRYCRTCYSRQP